MRRAAPASMIQSDVLLRRRPCLPRVVRHLVRVHAHKSEVLDRATRQIYALEVRRDPWTPSSARTEPFSRRQTVFYTPDTITAFKDKPILGRLSCAPNARNPRDLDITITYQANNEPEVEVHYKMCVHLSDFPGNLLLRVLNRTLTGCQVLIYCIALRWLWCAIMLTVVLLSRAGIRRLYLWGTACDREPCCLGAAAIICHLAVLE